MRRTISLGVAAALLALTCQTPASAAISIDPSLKSDAGLTQVRFGGGHRRFMGHRPGGFRGRFHGGFGGRFHHRGYGYRGYHRGGYGVGAGIAGLAAGAIIGGAIAEAAAPRVYGSTSGRTVAYCEQHFKSYNRATRTYLGYDGRRHSCP